MEVAPIPINGCALVKLTSDSIIEMPDKQYATCTSGVIMEVAKDEGFDYLRGKQVYFEEYKDGTQFEIDDEKYALIKLEDIRGYREQIKS